MLLFLHFRRRTTSPPSISQFLFDLILNFLLDQLNFSTSSLEAQLSFEISVFLSGFSVSEFNRKRSSLSLQDLTRGDFLHKQSKKKQESEYVEEESFREKNRSVSSRKKNLLVTRGTKRKKNSTPCASRQKVKKSQSKNSSNLRFWRRCPKIGEDVQKKSSSIKKIGKGDG